MGLQLEVTSGRTLTIAGTKKVIRVAQRKNATTHSYTVQITLNASGILPPKLAIVMYEPGDLPQYFYDLVGSFDNLEIYWSKSGWMGKEIAKSWMKEFFLALINEEGNILIIDSWVGYKEMKSMPEVAQKKLRFEVLPAGSTSILQPADVFFNRTFKNYIRMISDRVRWRHEHYVLSVRRNLLTLLDLVHNQFKAPRYVEFLKYSWYRAGYFSEHPAKFETPVQFCLQFKGYIKCERDGCNNNYCFMRCSYCELYLCFTHVIDHRH